jgi:hypothetical protein
MTPNWTNGIVGQITNHAATPNQALHLTAGASSMFLDHGSPVPPPQAWPAPRFLCQGV